MTVRLSGALLALCLVLATAVGGMAQQAPQRPPAPGIGAAKDAQQPAGAESEDDRLPKRAVIRFVTDADYPPFHYRDEEGVLTGFNIDVVRALCLEVEATCDIQVRPWEALIDAVLRGDADAIVASLAITPATLAKLDFSDRYYHMPARFASRRGAKLETTPEGLEGRRVAVIRGTAHEAYLRTFFRDSLVVPFESADLAREALRDGKADVAFDDGTSLSFWLNGTLSQGCCEFRGGPFMEPRYFGDGVALAFRKGDRTLRRLLNTGLQRMRDGGRYEELFLRYFPIKVY